MDKHFSIGKLGEDLACKHLEQKGCRILIRNYRRSWGELDIVGRAKDGTLVFFEVKTLQRAGHDSLKPEDNLSPAKLKKLRRTCQMFAARNPKLVIEKKGWRLDLIAITAKSNDDLADGRNCEINHYENV